MSDMGEITTFWHDPDGMRVDTTRDGVTKSIVVPVEVARQWQADRRLLRSLPDEQRPRDQPDDDAEG